MLYFLIFNNHDIYKIENKNSIIANAKNILYRFDNYNFILFLIKLIIYFFNLSKMKLNLFL